MDPSQQETKLKKTNERKLNQENSSNPNLVISKHSHYFKQMKLQFLYVKLLINLVYEYIQKKINVIK